MRSLDSCYKEIINGNNFNTDLMALALQMQRNEVLADIEVRLEILNMKMDDVKNKLDAISFSTFNAVNQ